MSICVLGSINMDIVLSVEHLPRPGETITGAGLAQYPGGKGANQAVAAARLGARIAMLGAVGADAQGEMLTGYLADAGVDVSAIARLDGETTGQAFISVAADGENAIIVVSGANRAFDPGLGENPALSRHGVFLSQLEVPVEAVERLFRSGAARAGTRILNAAPAVPEAAPLLADADILIVNEVELALFADAPEPPAGGAETERLCRALAAPGQTIVVTLGADGALAVTPNDVIAVAGRPVKAVDTTGAGDCFCGALAVALDQGDELRDALDFANAAAAIAVTRHGAGPSMPTRAEVDAVLSGGAIAPDNETDR